MVGKLGEKEERQGNDMEFIFSEKFVLSQLLFTWLCYLLEAELQFTGIVPWNKLSWYTVFGCCEKIAWKVGHFVPCGKWQPVSRIVAKDTTCTVLLFTYMYIFVFCCGWGATLMNRFQKRVYGFNGAVRMLVSFVVSACCLGTKKCQFLYVQYN